MNPLEKLREDVQYWQEEARKAREVLRIAERVLPGLEAQLRELEPDVGQAALPTPPDTIDKNLVEPPRFTGEAIDQVRQALVWKPEQSSEDLQENLKRYGRAYGRGAVGLALRELKSAGKAEIVRKQGNVLIYRLTTKAPPQA